jgi:putative peptidoglycan lipid II flippase
MSLNVVLSLTLPGVFAWMGLPAHGGLALANSVATLLEMGGLMALLRPRLGGLEGRALGTSVARSGLAAGAMGFLLVLWQQALPGASGAVVGAGGILLGAGAYLLAAVLIGMDEIHFSLRRLSRRSEK